MARTKIELDRKAVSDNILKNKDVMAHVRKIAQQIASTAGPQFVVDEFQGRTRGNVRVGDPSPGSLFREAEQGNLRRAVQAVRK